MNILDRAKQAFTQTEGLSGIGRNISREWGGLSPEAKTALTVAAAAAAAGGGALSGLGGAAASALPVVSAIGGSLSSARDQRKGLDQAADKLRETERYTRYDPKSDDQLFYEMMSGQNYRDQLGLAQQYEADIARRMGLQSQAGDTMGALMSGQAMQMTPEEMMRNDAMRSAEIDYDSDIINRMLDGRLSDLNADASRRGLRGQAHEQLNVGAVDTAARQLQDRLSQSNMRHSQRALDMPMQRAMMQGDAANQMTNYGSATMQQAMQNRAMLQNPAILQMLRQDRAMAGVNVAPDPSYGAAVMGRAMTPSDLTAGLLGFSQFASQASGALGGMAGNMFGNGAMTSGGQNWGALPTGTPMGNNAGVGPSAEYQNVYNDPSVFGRTA